MKNSEYIKTISINNPKNPGEKITLAIHSVDGGYVGVDANYIDEVANYIINPFEECDFVKLTDPMGSDDELDPPLREDAILGFVRLLAAFDDVSNSELFLRQEILRHVQERSKMSSDEVSMLLGMAKEILSEHQ